MKTERRHTLQTNLLAAYLAKKFEQIKPYTNWILGGALTVVVIAFIWTVAANYFSSGEDEAWQSLAQLISPRYEEARVASATTDVRKKQQEISKQYQTETDEQKKKKLEKDFDELAAKVREAQDDVQHKTREELEQIAKSFPDNPVGWSATLRLANEDLEDGSELMFSDLDNAHLRLEQAIERFKAVKEQARGSRYALVRHQAQLGLARAYEARNSTDPQHAEKDDLKRAAGEYEELVAQNAWCADFAQRRLAALKDPDKRFHEWFREAVRSGMASKTEAPSKAAGNGAATPGSKP